MSKRGERIHGSRMFRDFCLHCGEPMRIAEQDKCTGRNYCLECCGDEVDAMYREHAARTAGQKHGM